MVTPSCSLLARITRSFIVVATFLSCVASASAQTVVGPNDISYRENISVRNESVVRDSYFSSDRFWFSSGPSWLMNAMPAARVSSLRSPSIYDRDGEGTQVVYRYANDVGSLVSNKWDGTAPVPPFHVMSHVTSPPTSYV